MANRKTAAAKSAERLGGYAKPAAFDAEEQRLQAEFAGLDLTEEEQADLAEALRLRLGTNAEQMASRAILNRLRVQLREAVQYTLDHNRSVRSADVGRMPKSDAFRLHDRDGLAQLRSRPKKALTGRELDGGLAYRKRYEAGSRGLKSTLAEPSGSGAADATAAAARSALWAKQLEQVERLVLEGSGYRALGLLRMVAGEGRAITGLLPKDKRSGRDVDQAVELLASALRICADRLPLA